MKKIVIHRPGGYDKLSFETHPDILPGREEVLVDVRASGVNYADCCVRWGIYESAKKYVGWPITPGFEFSGTVKAVGSEVSSFKAGDAVFGISRFGAYASQIAVSSHQIFYKPELFNWAEAAAFPTVFMTAYHALFQCFPPRERMRLLIHSAAGGVGSALVQLSQILSATVVGVVGSSHKVDYLKALGVDHVIDKSKDPLWERATECSPQGYDAIFDANGPETLKQSYEHLAPTGKLVSYGFHTLLPKTGGRLKYGKLLKGWWNLPKFDPLKLSMENKSVIGFNLSFLFDRVDLLGEAMEDLLNWIEEGKIRPLKTESFPMSEAGRAHERLESGQSVGKIVLIT